MEVYQELIPIISCKHAPETTTTDENSLPLLCFFGQIFSVIKKCDSNVRVYLRKFPFA